MLYLACLLSLLIAVVVVKLAKMWRKEHLGGPEVARVGFAAAPIPIYILLPLAPFDKDLAEALCNQPVQLAIAAVAAILWTVADVKHVAFKP
jgi:hypothetical protein